MEPILSLQPAAPSYDTLPVYKITCYPYEKRDYRPYAQARACLTPAQLVVQMWAFEAHPRPGSSLEAVFAAPGGDSALVLWVRADGAYGCTLRAPGGQRRGLDCVARTLEGEDLQGVYWGIEIALDRNLAARELGRPLEEGGTLLGNFYKLSDDPDKPHRGSMAPADLTGERLYQPDALTPFAIVRY